METRELEKNLQLSPLLAISPSVETYGKRVEIKIVDSQLAPNTTYKIMLGNALVDNREATPYANFVYTFSTGAYFDSLELHGNVVDAETGKPDTATLVVLYQEGESDSAVIRKKPFYATKVDASGNFSFSALPQRPFNIYAIQETSNNYIYDYGVEKIGFLDHKVIPAINSDSSYTFYLFKDYLDTTSIAHKDTTVTSRKTFSQRSAKPQAGTKGKNNIGYRVNADTTNRETRSFELTQPLIIDLFTEISSLDTGKVYLSYENGSIEVEAVQKVKVDSGKIKLSTQWQPDKIYTLRLVKGWAKDTSGNELPPGKYFFRTKREDDYGMLKLHISSQYFGEQFVLFVYSQVDSIYQKPITDSLITIPLLKPGNYGMRIIRDENKNGKWDPGNFFTKKQPEKVIPYSAEIVLKAGWENEIDFMPVTTRSKTRSEVKEKETGTEAKEPGENAPSKEETGGEEQK